MKKLLLLLPMVLLAGCNSLTTKQEPATEAQSGDEQSGSGGEAVMEKEDAGEAMMESTESGEAMVEEEDGGAMAKTYTLAEVAKHGTADDCWLAIEGKVYNVTEYIEGGKHPGGAALLQGCGKDATELYNDRPNGSGAHSEKARSFLPNFLIGELAE